MAPKWKAPPLDCPEIVEGRRLFKEKQYEAAASAFREGIVKLEKRPKAIKHDGTSWTSDDILLSTKLFLLNSLLHTSNSDEALKQSYQIISQVKNSDCRCHEELVVMICQSIVKLVKGSVDLLKMDESNQDASESSHGDEIIKLGIDACRIVLKDSTHGTKKQRRLFYEFESILHEKSGNIEAAANSTEHATKEFPKNQNLQRRLRNLRLCLGQIDEAAENADAEAKAERLSSQRSHTKRKRQRRKYEQSSRLREVLLELEPDIRETLNTSSAEHDFFGGLSEIARNPHRSIDWNSIPPEISPESSITNKKGLRVRRKQSQLQSLYVILRDLIDAINTSGSISKKGKTLRIVDFGSGSGNSCLVFAWLLRNSGPFQFTLIDSNKESVKIGKERTKKAGLESSVTWLCQSVSDFNQGFDIGLATHLCGGATDIAMSKCLQAKAAFIVVPCCLGAIQFSIGKEKTHGDGNLQYPRSEWLYNKLSVEIYAEMTSLGDSTAAEGEEDKKDELRLNAKALLDADRLKLAKEAMYQTSFGHLGSKIECGPKSDVLCGICNVQL